MIKIFPLKSLNKPNKIYFLLHSSLACLAVVCCALVHGSHVLHHIAPYRMVKMALIGKQWKTLPPWIRLSNFLNPEKA